jgi:hypothetical protein
VSGRLSLCGGGGGEGELRSDLLLCKICFMVKSNIAFYLFIYIYLYQLFICNFIALRQCI